MADLDYRIIYPYNNQEIRIDNLLEGVYANTSASTNYFELIDSDTYNPSFCYLLQNSIHHPTGMDVYKQYTVGGTGEAINLNNFYQIQGRTLGTPVLKGCYPLHPTPSGGTPLLGIHKLSGDVYSSIKIENQNLYVMGINSGSYEWYATLPRVICLEMYGGGGAGGNSGGFTLTSAPLYVRMSGGGGSGGFFCAYIDTSHTYLVSLGTSGKASSSTGATGGSGGETVLKTSGGTRLAWAGGGNGGGGYPSTGSTPSGGNYGTGGYNSGIWGGQIRYATVKKYTTGLVGYQGTTINTSLSDAWFTQAITPSTGYSNFEESPTYQFPAIGTYTSNFSSGTINGHSITTGKIIKGAGAQSIYAPGDMVICGKASGGTLYFFRGHNNSVTTSNLDENKILVKTECFGAGGRGGYSIDGIDIGGYHQDPDMTYAKGTDGGPGGVIIKW